MAKHDVRTARELAGMTQVEVGELMAVRPETVCRWETGATPIPRFKWYRLLRLLKLTPEQVEAQR